ncbi:MAG: hypothetical protein DSY37_04915 [Hyperthermus sp.]|nr:MAG: hypothetical protein DSY37_04915 [Hyperthermus sp.]
MGKRRGRLKLKEHGTIVKTCRSCLRVALLYPSVYAAAVASLAYQNMYYMLNSMENVVAERFIATNTTGEEPPPRSLETLTPLHKFDVIIAPVSYELDLVTLARMLIAAGIQPLREPRKTSSPMLVLGGPVASVNPLVALGFADLILIGELEPLLPRLVEELASSGPQALETLACRPGFLASNCSRVARVWARDLDRAYHTTLQFRIPGSGEPWGEAYMVEVSRGCPYMCRFCMESHFLLPLRHRSASRVKELVERGVEVNQVSKVAFYALSFFDHPAADELLEYVRSEGLEASIGSLRGDQLSEDRIELIALLGQKHVSIAPETFSRRLCLGIGKCIGYEKVYEVAVAAWRRGMRVKLYLMLGLPGERDSDIEEYGRALYRLAKAAPPLKAALRVSINPLVPKPFTPLQYIPFIRRSDYERRVRILKRFASRVLEVDHLSYRYAYAQAVIARGDEKIARLIVAWAMRGGRLGHFYRAAASIGINLDNYTRGLEGQPAWHRYVDMNFPEKSLKLSYHESMRRLSASTRF